MKTPEGATLEMVRHLHLGVMNGCRQVPIARLRDSDTAALQQMLPQLRPTCINIREARHATNGL